MRSVELHVSAVIFDLDGVLADSRAAVDQTWREWSIAHGLDPEIVLHMIPGKRTRDAVEMLAPQSDVDTEAALIITREEELVGLVTPIPGAAALLERLPAGRWGIGTSGIDSIARSRLAQAGLPVPAVFITAEMVSRGKPDPEVYLRAARALGVDPTACAVFEDAPSGIAAATAAGCQVVGVLTWATPETLATAYTVSDLSAVRATVEAQEIRLELGWVP